MKTLKDLITHRVAIASNIWEINVIGSKNQVVLDKMNAKIKLIETFLMQFLWTRGMREIEKQIPSLPKLISNIGQLIH